MRKSKGFNLLRLSQELNIHPTYLGQIERGEKPPSIDVALNIANFFHIGFSYDVPVKNETQIAQLTEIKNKIQTLNVAERKFVYKTLNEFIFFNK